MKKYLILAVVAVIMIVFAVVSNQQNQPKDSGLITLTYAENKVVPIPNPFVIALNKGFFKEEGIDMKSLSVPSGKEALNAVLAGQAQFAQVAEIPLVFLGFEDQSMQIITSVFSGHYSKVIAKKDKGINQPSDLKGKKVALPKGTSAEFAFNEFLRVNGLSIKDIQLINLQPAALPPALANGEVDAYVVWEPNIHNGLKALEENALVFSIDPSLHRGYMYAAAKKGWLEKNSETVKKFLRALIRGEEFIRDNRQEALTIAANYTGLEAQIIDSLSKTYSTKIELNTSITIEEMEQIGNWLNREKPEADRKPLPDYRYFINSQFLREVSPERLK